MRSNNAQAHGHTCVKVQQQIKMTDIPESDIELGGTTVPSGKCIGWPRGRNTDANITYLSTVNTAVPHHHSMRRCTSHLDARVEVHVVVIEHNQSIRSAPSAHCGSMANIVCGESNNVEVVNVAQQW